MGLRRRVCNDIDNESKSIQHFKDAVGNPSELLPEFLHPSALAYSERCKKVNESLQTLDTKSAPICTPCIHIHKLPVL